MVVAEGEGSAFTDLPTRRRGYLAGHAGRAVRPGERHRRDVSGDLPAEHAARHGHTALVEPLRQRGAPVDVVAALYLRHAHRLISLARPKAAAAASPPTRAV